MRTSTLYWMKLCFILEYIFVNEHWFLMRCPRAINVVY